MRPKLTFVYALARWESGVVKIGVSIDPDRRQKEVESGKSAVLPPGLTAGPLERIRLEAVEDAGDYERSLHRRFKAYRVEGEWFRIEGAVARWLGLPPAYVGGVNCDGLFDELEQAEEYLDSNYGTHREEKAINRWRNAQRECIRAICTANGWERGTPFCPHELRNDGVCNEPTCRTRSNHPARFHSGDEWGARGTQLREVDDHTIYAWRGSKPAALITGPYQKSLSFEPECRIVENGLAIWATDFRPWYSRDTITAFVTPVDASAPRPPNARPVGAQQLATSD